MKKELQPYNYHPHSPFMREWDGPSGYRKQAVTPNEVYHAHKKRGWMEHHKSVGEKGKEWRLIHHIIIFYKLIVFIFFFFQNSYDSSGSFMVDIVSTAFIVSKIRGNDQRSHSMM